MIGLITKREYLSRVSKKSFIIMTLLGPLLIAGFYGAIIWITINGGSDDSLKTIEVVDYSGLFADDLKSEGKFVFIQNPDSSVYEEESYFGKLEIPKETTVDQTSGIRFVSENSLSLSDKKVLENRLESIVEGKKLERSGLRKEMLDSLKSNISILEQKSVDGSLQEQNSMVNAGVGFAAAFMIYIFIFLYGVQVMRGVVEEKTNRIVEVIISSVKPIQLMMGKILGIALVGLTQIAVWLVLGGILVVVISTFVGGDIASSGMNDPNLQEQITKSDTGSGILASIVNLPFGKIIFTFIFYFLSGYLLYSALFAAIAAAVDAETETQQFMFPVTIPLIFAFVAAQSVVIQDPHGTLGTWLSMIPLTSPIVMMVRIPFDVPWSELLMSMLFMILGFLAFTWLAARIYRIGILMYGKKASYKELWKWLWYKG